MCDRDTDNAQLEDSSDPSMNRQQRLSFEKFLAGLALNISLMHKPLVTPHRL